MQLKNISNRGYTVRNIFCAPGVVTTVPDAAEADIKGMDDLEIVGGAAIEENKSMTKAELQAALTDAGIDYPSTANKTELQALFDGAK